MIKVISRKSAFSWYLFVNLFVHKCEPIFLLNLSYLTQTYLTLSRWQPFFVSKIIKNQPWYTFINGPKPKQCYSKYFVYFQCLFDPFFISMYNIFFTSLPVMMLAMFEQVCRQFVTTTKIFFNLYQKLILTNSLNAKLFNFASWLIFESS